jgi:hypothetical protein
MEDEDKQIEQLRRRRNIRRKRRRWWARPWLHAERRLQYGHFHRLMVELRHEDATFEDGSSNV